MSFLLGLPISRLLGPASTGLVTPRHGVFAGGCEAWYDTLLPGGVTLTDGRVHALADWSGNNRHAVQLTAGRRPLMSGRRVTRAERTEERLDVPDSLSAVFNGAAPKYAITAVFRPSLSDVSDSFDPLVVADESSSAVDIPVGLCCGRAASRRGTEFATLVQRNCPTGSYYSQQVSFLGKLWSFGGRVSGVHTRTIHSSTDGGQNWTNHGEAPWSGRSEHVVIRSGNKLILIGGYDGSAALADEWVSTNGIDWNQTQVSASFGGRRLHKAFAIPGGRVALLDGDGGRDPWFREADGTWSKVTTSGGTWGTLGPRSVWFDGRLYTVSGSADNPTDDVWRLTGATWARIADEPGFASRRLSAAWNINGRLFVGTGFSTSYLTDVWESLDGVTWRQVTENCGVSAYGAFGCIHDGRATTIHEATAGKFQIGGTAARIDGAASVSGDVEALVLVDGASRSVYLDGELVTSGTVSADVSFSGSLESRLLGGTGAGSVEHVGVFSLPDGMAMSELQGHCKTWLNTRARLIGRQELWHG